MRNAKVLTVAALIAFAAVVAQAALQNPPLKLGSPIKGTADTVTLGNGIPPRFMWGWGAGLSGYCGEFSFQSFGLYFGNYISADRVRNAAGSELLIAVNDVKAATALKYTYEEWNYNKQSNPQGSNFLDWAATHIDNGHGVAAGFYEVVKSGGDDDYDHIMPIVGYKRDSTAAMGIAANGGKALLPRAPTGRTDVLGVYYNDLYRNSTLYGAKDSTFIKTRSGCRSSSAPSKAPYTFCLPQQVDYGIALTGVVDTKGELYATTLSVNSWTEPDYSSEDNLHEAIVQLTGSLVISGLTPGNKYSVLRFDSLSEVPSSGFATGPYTKKVDFTATSYTQSLPNFDTFRSDSAIFYRTVNGF